MLTGFFGAVNSPQGDHRVPVCERESLGASGIRRRGLAQCGGQGSLCERGYSCQIPLDHSPPHPRNQTTPVSRTALTLGGLRVRQWVLRPEGTTNTHQLRPHPESHLSLRPRPENSTSHPCHAQNPVHHSGHAQKAIRHAQATPRNSLVTPRPRPKSLLSCPGHAPCPRSAHPSPLWPVDSRLECLSHRAAARMSQSRREPLLLLYTNRLQCSGWNSAAVITSVSSSMLAGLMSTMSGGVRQGSVRRKSGSCPDDRPGEVCWGPSAAGMPICPVLGY